MRLARVSTSDTEVIGVSARETDDGGSAAIEFIVAGLILLVPIVYLIIALGQVQSHALGVEAGARHLARSVAGAGDKPSAQRLATRILDAVASEYGIDPDALTVSITCTPVGDGVCPKPGATVRVVVRADAALPLVPPVLGADQWARVPVEATAAYRVSRVGDP